MGKKFGLVGAGNRGRAMFAKPLTEEWKNLVQLVGLYDTNSHRAQLLSEECGGIPVFDTFEAMLKEAKPDTIIVVSPDGTHHDYIIRAMKADCDVITEKPMTINEQACAEILETERRTGRSVTVTFNARYSPYNQRVKRLLQNGEIGHPLHVHMETHLNRIHGADYFRRWHRQMDQSGGLLVHKATHHFDLVNWWLNDKPRQVTAFGGLQFYGPNREERGDRCLTCEYKDTCECYMDIKKSSFMQTYYLDAEEKDGYIRDACVFDPNINIYDNVSASVEYGSGTLLTFSLNAFSQYEGMHLRIEGTEGRLEADHFKSGQRADGPLQHIRVYKEDDTVVNHSMKQMKEGHSGGDKLLRQTLFGPPLKDDPLNMQADSYAGALSLLVGVAVNKSIKEGKTIRIQSLLEGSHSERGSRT